jgi:F-type H+-transporting ATPase subunit delta
MKATRRTRRAARRLYRLCVVEGTLNGKRARTVAERLASSRRRGSLPVLAGFLRFVRLDRDRHSARVESAAPLGDTAREQIRSGLARTYGASLETSFAENPALIGGVRVKVGSDVYDGTIRARLAALEARL